MRYDRLMTKQKSKESLADWVIRTTPGLAAAHVTKKAETLPPNLPRLIPLDVWAKLLLGEHAPHKNTLRNWVHNGRIYPMPVKIGKRWFVKPDAEYRSD